MIKKWILISFLFCCLQAVWGQYAPGLLALQDLSLFDVQTGKMITHQTVLIRGTVIEAVGPEGTVNIPDAAHRINCKGKFLLPGLIDTHVHLLSDVSETDNRARAERDSKAMLLTGITSVRDMAGDGRALASFARDAMLGEIIAPDVYYAAFFAGPAFFKDPRTHQASRGGVPGGMLYMRAITDSSDIPLAIAESKGTGASGIKLYAQLSAALAEKLTKEAQRQGLQVWSHLELTIASPVATIQTGANVVSHAGMIARWRPDRKDSIPLAWRSKQDSVFWDIQFQSLPVQDYMSAMIKNRTLLDATLLIEKENSLDNRLPSYTKAFYTARYELGRRLVKMALENGIPVCTGTDVDENRFVQREMKTLVTDAWFTPAQAIIAATLNGARAIGIDQKTGSVAKGKTADLLLLDADPLTDINHIDKVALIIKKGKLYNPR